MNYRGSVDLTGYLVVRDAPSPRHARLTLLQLELELRKLFFEWLSTSPHPTECGGTLFAEFETIAITEEPE